MQVIGKDEILKLIDNAESLENLKDTVESLDKSEVETMDLYEGDVVVIMFDEIDGVPELVQRLQDMYPDNPVIAIHKNIDLLIEQADEALEMLDGMKAKISILHDTPTTSKIIV